MNRILIMIVLLTSCNYEADIKINPYICTDGFRWDTSGNAITNSEGAQLTCEN